MLLQFLRRHEVAALQFALPSAVGIRAIADDSDVIVMAHLVGLDAAQHELVDLMVDDSCHSLRHRHQLTVVGCRPAHGT